MKKRIWLLCILQFIPIIFSGCTVDNFFDISSTMSPPRWSEERSCVESTIKNHLGKEVKFCQLVIGERYSSVVKYNFNGAEYIIVFCKTENTGLKSHIILLEKIADDWCVKDDMVRNDIEFLRVQIVRMDSEMIGELIVDGIDMNTKVPVGFSLCMSDNGTMQIKE